MILIIMKSGKIELMLLNMCDLLVKIMVIMLFSRFIIMMLIIISY